MNKLCRNALASCLSASLAAVSMTFAVPAASTASPEQDTAVAGMAVSLDNYYASSQTPEADIMDYIRYLVSAAREQKAIPVFTVNAVAKDDGSVIFGTSLVSEDASEKESGFVSVMASLNVRNKPSVSSNVIGYLYSNCVVSIYDTVKNDEGTWYLIKSGDVEGYVSADYVLTGEAAKASEEDLTNRYAKVTAESAVVYSSAGNGADSVGVVYRDGEYRVLEIQNGFVKIAVNEEFAGYVREQDVSLYTRHPQAVAITDQMVQNQLEAYLVDIRDAEAIFEKRMVISDYQAAYNASTYAYELWNYYISDASNAGYTDLVQYAKSEQLKTADMVARATAALNGETIEQTPAQTTAPSSSSMSETQPETLPDVQPSSDAALTSEETMPVTPTTVEDTTTTTAEETTPVTPTTVEDTTTTTAEETTPTTPTTVEDTTTTTAEETTPTTPTTVEDTTTTTAEEAVKTIQGIEAFYTGSSKTEGDVISASELYIVVSYTDGTTKTVTEGWSCDMVGMKLSAGWNTITVSYQGFSSSFELNVAKIENSSDNPLPTEPQVPSSETTPEETTTTAAEETPASTAEETTTTTTAEETTTTTTAEETTTTTTAEETTTTTTAEETTTTTTAEETTTTTAEETTTTQEITIPDNNSTPLRDALVSYALSWVGQCNYVYGGTDLSIGGSVDCSGFTMQVYSRVAGVSLPHHSMSQMNCGSPITYDQLRPGDLVFYNNPNHVAIYIGNGAIVHAGSPETGVNVTSVFFKTPIGYRTYLP